MIARAMRSIQRRIGFYPQLRYRMREAMEGFSGRRYLGHENQAFGQLTYAQHGEDLIILNIFDALGIEHPSWVDVGAHHPLNLSNTALLYARGCRGINIDANPVLLPAFETLRPEDVNLNVGIAPGAGVMKFYRIDDRSGRNTFDRETAEAFVRAYPQFRINDVIDVPTRTLDSVVDQYAGGRYPELLSVDAEGLDYDIVAGADFAGRGRPAVVCIEHVTGEGADGSARITGLLKDRGFAPLFRTVGNMLYVDANLAAQLT